MKKTMRKWSKLCLVGLSLITMLVCFLATSCMQSPSGVVSLPGRQADRSSQNRVEIPGSLPSIEEEIWVISRSRSGVAAEGQESPGSGSLVVHGEAKAVAVPLKHTEVKAGIGGYIATVEVVQRFHNPYDTKIEAEYVFPLPENAAVKEFIMTIGARRIRGIIPIS